MLYEILTGRTPFNGTDYEIMAAHVNAEPKYPASLNPALPGGVCNTILKAMAKSPADRYQTAAAMLADLGEISFDEAQTIEQMSIIDLPTPATLASGKAGLTPTPRASNDPARPQSKLHPDDLDSVSRELAAYIGPIAKVVVKRAADRCSSVDELYTAVASEINSDKDRSRFLAGKKR
jgi:serine/threonine-protein kinase